MRKPLLYFFLIIFLAYSPTARAEKLNLTSYYPAPAGSYKSIHLNPRNALPTTNCTLGTFYVNAGDNNLPYFCAPDPLSSIPTFAPLTGAWTLAGNNLYLTDPSYPENKKIGIGTTTPIFKLTLTNDGGILSDGLASTSSALSVAGAGTRLIWYPAKGAFRAGYVIDSEWDDTNIGLNTVALGYGNQATSPAATIWGGQNNTAKITNPPALSDTLARSPGSMIAGGKGNYSHGSLDQILGGENNSATDYTVIAGANNSGINYAVIGGGQLNSITGTTYAATIGGGTQNNTTGTASTISGGVSNTSSPNGDYNTISGGTANNLITGSANSTIGGGKSNTSSSTFTSIGGGYGNIINTNSDYATIGGGKFNTVHGQYSTIGGGFSNGTGSGEPVAPFSAVGGGFLNLVQNQYPSIIGGSENSALADFSVTTGYNNVTSGEYSFAAGQEVRLSNTAKHTFAWGCSNSVTPLPSISSANAFVIQTGKMGIRDLDPGALLEINGNASTDDYLDLTNSAGAIPGNILKIANNGFIGVGLISNPTTPLQFANGAYVSASGNFMNASSREFKENISELDIDQATDAFLKLTPVQYNYKNTKDHRYLGFIAEDVPDIVADKTRKGLSPMDIAAVLTKVIAHQQDIINEQKKTRQILLKEIAELKKDFGQ